MGVEHDQPSAAGLKPPDRSEVVRRAVFGAAITVAVCRHRTLITPIGKSAADLSAGVAARGLTL